MKSLQSILLVILFLGQISCVSYKDFSKEYGVPKPISFTEPDVYRHFELGEEYRIKSKTNETLDVAIIQIHEDHLVGIPIKMQKDSTIKIPFEDIVTAKKKDYKRERGGILTSIPLMAIMGVVLLTLTLVTISVSN